MMLVQDTWVGQAGSLEEVTLAWDANTEPDLAGYRLFYGDVSGGPVTEVDAGNTTTITISGLEQEVTNFFYVTAYNSSGLESDPSNAINHTVTNQESKGNGKNANTLEAARTGSIETAPGDFLSSIDTIRKSADGIIVLLFRGKPKASYSLETSTDLRSWQWLDNIIMGTDGIQEYIDPPGEESRQTFYRLRPKN